MPQTQPDPQGSVADPAANEPPNAEPRHLSGQRPGHRPAREGKLWPQLRLGGQRYLAPLARPLRGPFRLANTSLKAGLDLLLPAHCLACAQPTQVPSGLCAACFGSMAFIRPPLCDGCGTPLLVSLDSQALCPACEEPLAVSALARTRAVGLYQGALAELIKAYKHGDRLDLVPRLAQWMQAAGQELLHQKTDERQPPLIVPIPLHWRRHLKRRYNQSGLLAQALARSSRLPLCQDALLRQHFIASQKGQSADERFANLYEAFRTRPKRRGLLQDRRIILIDDVRTTGATLQSAGETLIQSGARQVDALVIALVPAPKASYLASDPQEDSLQG